jgi:hypothetical protein
MAVADASITRVVVARLSSDVSVSTREAEVLAAVSEHLTDAEIGARWRVWPTASGPCPRRCSRPSSVRTPPRLVVDGELREGRVPGIRTAS